MSELLRLQRREWGGGRLECSISKLGLRNVFVRFVTSMTERSEFSVENEHRQALGMAVGRSLPPISLSLG